MACALPLCHNQCPVYRTWESRSRLFYLENFETVLNVEEVALGDEEELLDLPVVQGRVGPARRPVAHRHQSRLEPAQDLKPVDVFLNSHLWRLHQVCLLEAYYHFCFKWSGAVLLWQVPVSATTLSKLN